MIFRRYLALSKFISFRGVVFIWFKLTTVLFILRFEDIQNLAYEGLAVLFMHVGLYPDNELRV